MGWMRRSSDKEELHLSEEEVYGQLEKRQERDHLFLWRYTRQQLAALLEQTGVLPRIRELGYTAPHLTVTIEEGQHIAKLETEGETAPLMDLRINEESRVPPDSLCSRLGPEPLALVVVQWVSLQHVRASFTAERPPLPGQCYPGLGAGRRLYRMLRRMARELGKDGFSAYPRYYHNAVYYSDGFSYLDPFKQGELRALKRDLAGLALPTSSEGIEQGLLRSGSGDRPVVWEPGEMVAPVSRRLRAYFISREYRAEAKRIASGLSFRIADP